MTWNEEYADILIRVVNARTYLVVEIQHECAIGSLMFLKWLGRPVRIASETTREEYEQQCRLICEWTGETLSAIPEPGHFYRVTVD